MARQMLKTSCAKASFAQAEDFIKECQIENDYFDITNVKYAVPTYWDIAKVYNSSFYYDTSDCIYQSYLVGKPL